MGTKRTRMLVALAVAAATLVTPANAAGRTLRVGGFEFGIYLSPQTCVAESPVIFSTFAAYHRGQCGFVSFIVDGGGATQANGNAPELNPKPGIRVEMFDERNRMVSAQDVTHDLGDTYRFDIDPKSWNDVLPGNIRFKLRSTSGDTLVGQTGFQFQLNHLGTRTLLERPSYDTAANGLAKEPLTVKGVTWERYHKSAFIASDPTDGAPNPDLKPGDVKVTLTRLDGKTVTKETTASADGLYNVSFSPSEIGNLRATARTNYESAIKIRSFATYDDPVTGLWRTASVDSESIAHAIFRTKPTGPQVEASFVSERGWVAPGETYVHKIEVRNGSGRAATGVTLSDALPPNAVYLGATPAPTRRSGNTLVWNLGTLPNGAYKRILVTARARNGRENPRVLYTDLSSRATLSYKGGSSSSLTHGPQVRMDESNRLGDRPFPVVLVDYADFKHSPAANGWSFHNRINEPRNPGSLYSLYREMSFGQLHPKGTVASFNAPDGATFAEGGPYKWSNPYLGGNTCQGVTLVPPSPVSTSNPGSTPVMTTFTPPGARVHDGWYQLPGQRSYYGADDKGTAIEGPGSIDGGCGPAGKLAYDAASAADPDLDYNDYDSDRNCLVDFFEIAFQGRGGHADSHTHGYDNVWPHSGNLQDTYVDDNGQLGYVSNDQCRDRLERPLWWTDASRSKLTTRNTGPDLKAFSRVGPYNVNPENGTTSVFSHEYGHSLGLPDYYSGDRDTIDYWDLMATDGNQFISGYGRAQLGWVVPRIARTGSVTIRESKTDTHRIDAVGFDGKPYSLTGSNVHNADVYYVPLKRRTLFSRVPSGKHGMWSTAGNGYGCPGRTLDIKLDTTLAAPEGTPLSLTFKSWYEIEWDYDYGFVMLSSDGGRSFTALESKKGTTTPRAYNPNNNGCQQTWGNGITGTSTPESLSFPGNLATRMDNAYPEPSFVDDEYDVSACAGTSCIIRFAYSSDTGVAKRGWVLDDVTVAGGTKKYFHDTFESDRLGTYAGAEWLRMKAGPSTFDHGYYLEMRDRIRADYDSMGQVARHPIDWIPGISIWYTDMAHGDGNNGTDDPPAQITIDPRKQTSDETPRLRDASFFPLAGINAFSDKAWIDNYVDADGEPFALRFGCFSMRVTSMSGLGNPGRGTAKLSFGVNRPRCG